MPTTSSQNTLAVEPTDAAADAVQANDINGGTGEGADPAAGEKRPAEGGDNEDTSNKKAKTDADDNAEPTAEDLEWNTVTETVREKLRSMDPEKCFEKAIELQLIARQEVESKSAHLSTAMDLMDQQNQLTINPEDKAAMLAPVGGGTPGNRSRNLPNLSLPAQQRVTKAEREVNKQKPIKNPNSAGAVPCMKMTPPLPPRCEGDPNPTAEVPAFCQLVNFPTARYFGNCVMCDDSEFSIPKQNKGVCNNCDVAIWVVNPSGMQIKWCKGCKNFRKWIDFGVKGYSSKCERCRTQQASRYASQKAKNENMTATVDGGLAMLPPQQHQHHHLETQL
eukprot:CAMPEP_0201736512 /NCGR_PEP_ID=MMETSP0593-20130828/40052_1 /ASSEMBLY_ACC=CAM_ASM_000672 /TAXON_ID=267983 /ORGANISM="Skeletonema japonicum, Strain CCMP2506" /LENGTH=334 /DNA_ID=CAMNT_0048230293 /DNA_START=41 /DNA_END=1045 /DNA_ORIENTATION=+